ncbi:xanthine dehydrogenase family protein molybdopterin-binding subunit [Bradyrhizobium sp. 157]|uniref:xanthine dehydrogenase family protein molybdopterin-binding subunit n=1 Tax=Bradyrhizobium sp. 157 TaxID=2782631 RepID=UPI001FF92128|nr:xanthine dehydrogenase family protein molybdopterin-binding subunit [Bradyrhizobium sp. 157]MCK1638880.1 xanthine dehydrogenase family protein molybdopterin-binding subunit [Bradyrhizobium sp. 157]
MTTHDVALSRRTVLKGAAGLVIGLHLPEMARAQSGAAHAFRRAAGGADFAPNAFIRIGADDTVTVLIKHIEFGQGPFTGLATLVAEELDADWSKVRAEHAPANADFYKNLAFGVQGTGGSTAIANSYDQMRKAGATARAMLVAAAAQSWGVPAPEITVERGVLRHAGTGREGRFGQFAEAAARQLAPADPPLKDPSVFRLIGRDDGSVKKLDSAAKSDGTAQFTIDMREPGMLTVVVARPPWFGARVASFDASAARAVQGVVDVKQVPTGVAVYANGTWPAIKGREQLRMNWDDSAAEKRSSDQLIQEYRALARRPGRIAGAHGDAITTLARAERIIEAEYVFPYLAHAPMEPLDGFLRWDGPRAHARFGSQLQTLDHQTIATVLGLKPEQVELETMLAGGSFGRRAQQTSHLAEELAEVAKAIGPGRPVKLVWTREDDIRGGYYRPLIVHRMRGGLRDGKIVAWADTIVSQSILKGSPFEAVMAKGGIDATSVEGAREIPYDIVDFRCDLHTTDVGVPVLWWRSVGHTHTGYAVECFVDELLQATGLDPVAGRLAMMGKAPREAGVLRAVAELAQWSGPGPVNGRARGVAVVKSFDSYVAQIAEVSAGDDGPRVHKVWCAVDCGVPVNPDVIRAQMEGGIGFGVGAALYGEVALDQGRPVPANFDTYRVLRIHEMPQVEVRVVNSTEKPTGVGEPGVPPIGPAVANAMARLGLGRPRRLPLVRAVA